MKYNISRFPVKSAPSKCFCEVNILFIGEDADSGTVGGDVTECGLGQSPRAPLLQFYNSEYCSRRHKAGG